MIPAAPLGMVVRRSILYLAVSAGAVKVLEYDESRVAALLDPGEKSSTRLSYGPTENTVPVGDWSGAFYDDQLWVYGADELWVANDGDAVDSTTLWITVYRYERARR